MKLCLIILALSLTGSAESDQCHNHETCGNCMSNPDCLWCSDIDHEGFRCVSTDSDATCKNSVSVSNEVKITSDLPISSSNLIKPQYVELNLRPGSPQDLDFEVQQSDEYPLDMYFLFDLSFSMNVSRNTLAEQAGNIIGNITKITKDFQIGFGSFVDKDLPPFTSTNRDFNCPPKVKCRPPYSFFHKTSIKKMSKEEFKENVISAPMAGNVDNPEGSLDALMQVSKKNSAQGFKNILREASG